MSEDKSNLNHHNNENGIIWTIHPLKKNWKVSTIVIIFLILLCTSIYISFNSLAFLLLSILILFVSLVNFFFPTTYYLLDDGLTVKSIFRKLSRDWSTFKSFYPDKKGILLSPFISPSRLENFRGVYIRFDNNGSKVIDYIKLRLK
jgi:hypothetical protein